MYAGQFVKYKTSFTIENINSLYHHYLIIAPAKKYCVSPKIECVIRLEVTFEIKTK